MNTQKRLFEHIKTMYPNDKLKNIVSELLGQARMQLTSA
jgi:hypothetical protein